MPWMRDTMRAASPALHTNKIVQHKGIHKIMTLPNDTKFTNIVSENTCCHCQECWQSPPDACAAVF